LPITTHQLTTHHGGAAQVEKIRGNCPNPGAPGTKKEKSKKLLKRDAEKIQAKPGKDIAQKKKRNDDSKPKTKDTQGKIKKLTAK